MLTLRDAQSSKTHPVPEAGVTIGREGGDADITVRNAAVSKRHARVFASDGGWWLEDLRSSNGTFIANERLTEPVQVNEGMSFALAGYKFEVVAIEQADEPSNEAASTMEGKSPPPGRPPPRAAPPPDGRTGPAPVPARGAAPARPAPPPPRKPATTPPKKSVAPVGEIEEPPAPEPEPEPEQEQQEQEEPAAEPPAEEQQEEAAADGAAVEGAAGEVSASSIMKELPRAIAYYMLTVPKLALNPLGTIKKSIEDQKFPGMTKMTLAGWALPGIGTTAAVGVICAFIVVIVTAIRGGGFLIGSLISSIIFAAISGIVLALVVAFLFHPVMTFVIKLLKGESDEKSRTNYLIIAQAGSILSAIPSGLATIITAFALLIPVVAVQALLPILPGLLSLYATLVNIALFYFWMKHFNVHKVFPLVIKIAGVLAIVGFVFSMLGSIRTAISSIGSGTVATSTPTIPTTTAAADDDDHAAKPLKPPDDKKATDDKKDTKAPDKADTKQPDKVADKGPDKADAKSPDKVADKGAEPPKKAKDPEPESEPPPKKGPTPGPEADSAPAVVPTGSLTAYQRFAERREYVEKTIEKDPTLLTGEILSLYKELHAKQRDIRKLHAAKGPDEVVVQRLYEAEAFKETANLVDDLYKKLQHH